MSPIARLAILAVFLPLSAAAQPEPPDFLEEITLTARFHFGAQNIRQTLRPIARENLQFLDRPVDPTIRYRAAPYYGVSAGLRFRGAELFGMLRTDGGFYPKGTFTGTGGREMFHAESVALQGGARLQYFILEHIGAGLKYRESNITVSAYSAHKVDEGERPVVYKTLLYRSKRRYRALSLYVPLRYAVGPQLSLDGRIGLALTVQPMRVSYDLSYAPLKRAPEGEDRKFDYDPTFKGQTQFNTQKMNLQFGEIGLTYRGLGLPLRLAFEVERIGAPRISELWKTGFNLRLGLPF